MVTPNTLGELLTTLFDRRPFARKVADSRSIEALCLALLSGGSDVSGHQVATAVLSKYNQLDDAGKADFFLFLNEKLDLDAEAIIKVASAYAKDASVDHFKALGRASEPMRQEVLRGINQAPQATAELVRMRADLLTHLKTRPELGRTDLDFSHLLSSWFNRGFLVLRQITWDSPASILEKIIAYEAVHEIRTWDDLRSRLHPPDRRCFAFFHPAMPNDPLIFVEVALAKGIPSSIHDVLAPNRKVLVETEADTAVFYSISNCQNGLAGISFGNSLIKQVVSDLARSVPSLKTFVTLSPIPGLVRWLEREGLEDQADDPKLLTQLAARYLLDVKTPDGRPLDPVARFHLGNGAIVHGVHPHADKSENGMAQSHGTMVNYLYDLSRISQNVELLAQKNEVAAASALKSLAKQAAKAIETRQSVGS